MLLRKYDTPDTNLYLRVGSSRGGEPLAMMTSRSLAFTTIGAKEQRARASEASKDAIGMMGIRIHELMSAIEDNGLQNDNELQLNLRELQRVLERVSPVLQKVSKKVAGTPADFERLAGKDGSLHRANGALRMSPTSIPSGVDNQHPQQSQLELDRGRAVMTERQQGGIHETVEHSSTIRAGEVQPTGDGGLEKEGQIMQGPVSSLMCLSRDGLQQQQQQRGYGGY